MHYLEYLCQLIRKHQIDTIDMLSAEDLENVVRRAAKKLPPFGYGTPTDMYRKRLLQVLAIIYCSAACFIFWML